MDVEINTSDLDKIEQEAEQLRLVLFRIYKLGYLQGQIDMGAKVSRMLKEPA